MRTRGVLALLLAATIGCGAEGTEAPPTRAPAQPCRTLDALLATFNQILYDGQIPGLAEVLDRLAAERNGARVGQVLKLLFEVLQAFPRQQATEFQFDIVFELVDRVREPLLAVTRYLAEGPDERRRIFTVLREGLLECPSGSIILTVDDLFGATDLLAAAGDVIADPAIVGLLQDIPDFEEQGRAGFVALIRTVVNALQTPSFDIAELRAILDFLDLDEPPLSHLLTALDAYLRDQQLEHLRATLACLQGVAVGEANGVEVLGELLFDLITLEALDLAGLLELATPLLEQLRASDIQILGSAAIDLLIEDEDLRELAIDLIAFLLRSDNIVTVVQAVTVLLESRTIDDLVALVQGLTVRCRQ